MSGIHPRTRSSRGLAPWLAILMLLATTTALAGCGVSSTVQVNTGATATARARATEAAQPPVTMVFTSIIQSGTVAAHNPRLTVTVTVTNHTDQAVHLVKSLCEGPLLKIYVGDRTVGQIWTNLFFGSCGRAAARTSEDRQTVAAHASGTVTTLCDLSRGATTPFQAGATYGMVGEMLWRYTGGEQNIDQPGAEKVKEVMTQAPASFTLK